MSGSIVGRRALAVVLGVAFARQIATGALAQSTNAVGTSQQQEQLAKSPVSSQDGNSVTPWISDQRNGAGLIIDPVYGIPVPGQASE